MEESSPKSVADRLKDLKAAHDEGLLTDEEFATYRNRLLEALVRA